MPSANTKRIEESATTALKAALLRCPILDSYIDSNDKTPSWDGTVFVYKSEKTKKENLAKILNSTLLPEKIPTRCSSTLCQGASINTKPDGFVQIHPAAAISKALQG